MTTHFSILAWKIPWTKETGRLWSMGSQRVRHDWVLMHISCIYDKKCYILFYWSINRFIIHFCFVLQTVSNTTCLIWVLLCQLSFYFHLCGILFYPLTLSMFVFSSKVSLLYAAYKWVLILRNQPHYSVVLEHLAH